ncbi:UNVERIFIED_ORG: hypothetical protein ABIB21_002341 [Arthrobacter sp. UYEF13]
MPGVNEYYVPWAPIWRRACGSAVVEVTIPSGQETWIDEAAASLTSAVPVEATILGTQRRVLPPGSMEHIYDTRSLICHAFDHP